MADTRELDSIYSMFLDLKQLIAGMESATRCISQYYGNSRRFRARVDWLRNWVQQFSSEGLTSLAVAISLEADQPRMISFGNAVKDYSAYVTRLAHEVSNNDQCDELFNLLVEIPGELSVFAGAEAETSSNFSSKPLYQVVTMRDVKVAENIAVA